MKRALRLARLGAGGMADRVEQARVSLTDRQAPARRSPGISDLAHIDLDHVHIDLDHVLERAVEFLLHRQDPDGTLRGFLLLPGTSTSWITAHVALVLEDVPEALGLCDRAAGRLSSSLGPEGWGFNHRVGADIDSTAQALLVLHRFGLPIEERALGLILRSQHPEGGFPTYPPHRSGSPENGWQAAHPDVTLVVVELLRRLGGHDESRARAIGWLRHQYVDGVAPSYWWASEAYGVWMQSRAGLGTPGSDARARALMGRSDSAPWSAMALDAALQIEDAAAWRADLVNQAWTGLVRAQRGDGSWGCQPCLRVTDWRCHQSLASAPGRVHRDRSRVFSTAHAVAALARLRRSQAPATSDVDGRR